MTEYNVFCYSKKYNDSLSFQQAQYRAFNQVVGKDRYYKILDTVQDILGKPNVQLSDFWKQVTQDQWNKLLAIPEAKNFKEGFEYISGQKIGVTHTITIDGKEIELSEQSFQNLKKQLT